MLYPCEKLRYALKRKLLLDSMAAAFAMLSASAASSLPSSSLYVSASGVSCILIADVAARCAKVSDALITTLTVTGMRLEHVQVTF